MATILPTGETTFFDQNGVPLAGGSVEFYIPGTTTPKDTWQNSGQSILNANPVTLDSSGRAIIYGSGSYRQIVKDSIGNLIWDQETSEPNSGSVSFGGTSSGTSNAQTLTAAQFSFIDGQIISFIAGLSNTGATTMSIGGSTPIPVVKNSVGGPVALVANDIVAGNSYFIQYSTSLAAFNLLLSVAPSTASGSYLAGFLFGLTLSNNGSDPVNDINITVGHAASDAVLPVLMSLSSPLGKRLDAPWVAGGTPASANGGLDTGAITDATYHVWLIQRSDTGVVDALFSLSPTSPTMPASYDRKRRIGSIIRKSGTILGFTQTGNIFDLSASVVDRNSTAIVGSSLVALTVPSGIRVQPKMAVTQEQNTTGNIQTKVASAGAVTAPITITKFASEAATALVTSGFFTDTSSQIQFEVQSFGGSLNLNVLSTIGWIDDRGTFA
ncbi:hypothetical protein DXM27_05090 [Rhizobium rhizogenes]|uniref:Uncharacterized protein n=1 Tax=Rhizobium rhizogenes TaxID=359 RepID=A0AA88F316_RHIRH|nr:hypothetical protein [Rhizobium rhizogenes]KAA3504590.1 hypothetical protein DXM27_05090 [Rhizobium rhizogenes]